MEALLPLHVAAGAVALLVGAVALVARKGGRAHRRTGATFVLAMTVMGLTGALLALARGQEASVVAGLLATYLVVTAFLTLRPRFRPLDVSLALGALALGTASIAWGLDTVFRLDGTRTGIPAPIFFVFGSVALVGGASDFRHLRRGGHEGARRIARHLWRMCFALWIASASFFLGQIDVFPEPLRVVPVLALLAFLPLLVMLYWLWRVRLRRSLRGLRIRPP